MTWAPSSVVSEEWGRYQIVVGGKDVTTFRGVETQLSDWSDNEPFGSGPASLVFPGITELEKVGAGALHWLREMPRPSPVDLYRINPDGVREAAPRWSGYVSRFVRNAAVNDGALTCECSGNVEGTLSLVLHQPRQTYALRDIGTMMIRELRHYNTRITGYRKVTTGIRTWKRGSRSQYALDFVQELLSIAQTDDGNQWTLRRDPTRRATVTMVLKDRTTVHATVYAGGRGVALGLQQDLTSEPNRIFGEGTAPDGNVWRNVVLPNLKPETAPAFPGDLDIGSAGPMVAVWQAEVSSDGYDVGTDWAIKSGVFAEKEADAAREIQRKAGLPITGVVDAATWAETWANGPNSANLGGSRFDPLAADPRTIRWLFTSNGSLKAASPTYDGSVMANEVLFSYGEGISKRDAIKAARKQLALNMEDPGWYGTITLTSDPEEMSRHDLRAGMNIRLKLFNGDAAGRLFHIAQARHGHNDPAHPVTLTVDTKARDLLNVVQMIDRDRESRQDPAKNYLNQRRRSANVRDAVVGWDKEAGYGVIPDRDLQGGRWNMIPVVTGQFGRILSTELTVEPPCKFYAAVFGQKVTPGELAARVPSPGSPRGDLREPFEAPEIQDWLGYTNRSGKRLAIWWGNPGQAAGYWPGEEAKGHAPTGKLRDDASWDFISGRSNWVWLLVWPQADCTISGIMKNQVVD